MKTLRWDLVAVLLGLFTLIGVATMNEDTGKNERINMYNSGYRAGAMHRLAQLVECDGVTDPAVLRDYHATIEVLKRMGELETTPFPCEE